MNKLISNKRGDMFQLLFLLIILFISAIVGLIFLKLSSEVNSQYKNLDIMEENSTAYSAVSMLEQTAPRTTDYMVFFLFLGGIIGVCVSAVRTNFSVTLVFLFIILLFITIFVAAGFVNIYSGFANTDTLQSTSEQLTFTNFIFSRYAPAIFAILGGLVMLLMWGKSGGDIIT